MRSFVTILIALGVATLHVLDNPKRADRVWGEFKDRVRRAMTVQEVRVEGLSVLSRTEVERLIPVDRSLPWWKLHITEIQASVEKNPWVAEALVSQCPGTMVSSWGCFVISIKERVPAYSATVDNAEWIIAQDGSFITTRADALARGRLADLITVKGLASRNSSPDLVRGQLASVTTVVSELRESVGRDLQGVEFLPVGDISVRFDHVPFPVIFAAARGAKVSIAEQGARCAELLRRFQDRFGDIEKVDLAFDRVGTIKLRSVGDQAPG